MTDLMNDELLDWEFNDLDASLEFYLYLLYRTSPIAICWGGGDLRKIARKTLNSILIKRLNGRINLRDPSVRETAVAISSPGRLRLCPCSGMNPSDEVVRNMMKFLAEIKYIQTEKPLINNRTDDSAKTLFLQSYESLVKQKALDSFGVLSQERINKEMLWLEMEALFFDLIDDFSIEKKLDILYGVAHE